jgi:hypothetical protein
MGYFQHDGTVVLQDFGGGKVASVSYSSRDPLAKTLGAFSINLNGNPSLGQLLMQVRGEAVELASPNAVTGTLIGVEKKQEVVQDGSQRRVVETEYINLLTDDGFRSIPLPTVLESQRRCRRSSR